MPTKSSKAVNPAPALSKAPRVRDSATGEISSEPELAKAIQAINGRRSDPGDGMLGLYWELGRLVEALVKTRKDRPGSKVLAKSLGVEETRLKVARNIFSSFPTKKEKERLLAMRRADGTPLPIQAIARLCSASLKANREALFEQACRENWSEYDAKDKLKASRRGNPRGRTGGRKHRPPRSLPLALARWHREADGLIRSVEAASRPEVIADLLASPDAAQITVEDIREVRRVVQHALMVLKKGVEALEKIEAGITSKKPPSDPAASPPTSGPQASTGASKRVQAKRRSRA